MKVMPAAPLTKDEPNRLRALRALEILDTLPEACFDDLTRLASAICDAPIAQISFVDQDRQWFKSEAGSGFRQLPRDQSFCAHALHEMNLFIVEDAAHDARFADNPLVTAKEQIRFYAGMPLDSAGFKVGTLCVLDNQPRTLTERQQESLAIFGRQVEALLTLRLQARELLLREAQLGQVKRQKDELLALLVHDLKNPLASILLNGHLLELERQSELSRDIVTAAESMRRLVGNLLDVSRSEEGTLQVRLEEVQLQPLFAQLAAESSLRARQAGKELQVLPAEALSVRADPELLRRILGNLVDNAVKQAMAGKVQVAAGRSSGAVELRVEDQGPGPGLEVRELFLRTSRQGGAAGKRLGLAFCRLAAQAQGGSLRVEESPLGGSAFVLTLPGVAASKL